MSDQQSGGTPPPWRPDQDATRFGGPTPSGSYGQSGEQPQQPYGQQPYGGSGPQQPFGGQPGQPYGQQPGQGGYGGGYGGGGFNQPPYGPQGGGGGKKNGLVIGLVALIVLVLVGGIGIAFAVAGGDDDGDDTTTADPTNSSSTAPSEDGSTEPSDGASSDAAPVDPEQNADGEAPNGEFEADYNSDTGQVCEGKGMINSEPYDAADPKIAVFQSTEGSDRYSEMSVGYDRDWKLEYKDFQDVQVVACVTYKEDSGKKIGTCEAEDSDKNKIKYDYYSAEYEITFHRALNYGQLGDAKTVSSGGSSNCPMFVFGVGNGDSYYAPADNDDVEAIINQFARGN